MNQSRAKQKKEMQQRLLIKRTMTSINKYIAELDAQKEKYIEAAKKAKLKGSAAQYSLALSGLKTAMAQQKKAEEMLLNFELTSQMRDLAKMTSGFLNGMSVLSREMSKITKSMDFAKIHRQFEDAMMGVEATAENLDVLLTGSDSSFHSLATGFSKITNEEIDRLIERDLSGSESEVEKDLELQIEEIKKSLKEI